jgi:beta-D-galactosyl-(1->4)-L-rhamnose phosphorylase
MVMITNNSKGSFTLPGEAGYENLTLKLANKWGADVIRDSDGTQLSDEITNSGYGIYSTICLIRSDNAWAKNNTDKLQQNFLMSFPVIAEDSTLEIEPLSGYFRDQFTINGDDSKEFWQVFDRTTGQEVDANKWTYNSSTGKVTILNATPWHKYTVNFLATRLWEEISMYNHITNDWGDKERLMAVEPRYPEVSANILEWLEKWCIEHPATTVVRFTSMFYNFAWFWGDDLNNRHLYGDWGSYDFTANTLALRAFEQEKGYKMTSEDFVNGGNYNSTHNAPTKKYKEWMDFINRFVIDLGKKCIDIVHKYNKQAYVFYDDSWIGVEPYGERFKEFGFDGIIKCVFSGFEARMGAGVKGVETHELRLHPYLFPTGLTGEPTFAPGGNPKLDASKYWVNVRRALLRKPVDRIGLGGYLHLVEPFPDFCDYMEEIADEFRLLKSFHEGDKPYTIDGKVVILTAWGELRSWICSGHLHEHPEVDLTNILEALAGLPLNVEFMSFDDVINKGISSDVKVMINAGCLNSAWSGGDSWKEEAVITKLTEWVANGGGFIGVNEPSATISNDTYFRLSHLLGVDRDTGSKKCLGKYQFSVLKDHFITKDTKDYPMKMKKVEGIFVLDKDVKVVAAHNGNPIITTNEFGKGRAIYMSSFRFSIESSRMLFRSICYAMNNEKAMDVCVSKNIYTECAYYPVQNKLVAINNSEENQETVINTLDGKQINIALKPFETVIL